ncbi:MAG: hypothetical protein ACLGJB_08820 [Blastocatellia bacterium]
MYKATPELGNSIGLAGPPTRGVDFIVSLALLLLFTLSSSAGAAAQSARGPVSPLAPPLVQDEEAEQKTGHKFTITYGFAHNLRSRSQDVKSTVMRGPLSFSISVAPWLTIKVGNDTFKSKKPLIGDRVTGFGDTSLTLISKPVSEQICDGAEQGQKCVEHPSVTMIYTAVFPTASKSKGIGSGEVDHSFLAAVGKTVGGSTLEVDFGAYLAGRTDRSGFINIGLLNLVFERELDRDGKWVFHTELDGTAPTEIPSTVNAIHWMIYKPNDKVSFKFGVRNGITANAPKFGYNASITYSGMLP